MSEELAEKKPKSEKIIGKTEPLKVRVAETLIYCGPNLAGELQQFSVFKNGMPKHIHSHLRGCPSIKQMFVSPKNLAKMRIRLKEQGSRENQLYKKIEDYLKGARK